MINIILAIILILLFTELHYILFRNPNINKFSVHLLSLISLLLLIQIFFISFENVSNDINLLTNYFVVYSCFFFISIITFSIKILKPHKPYEKPNSKYLLILMLLSFFFILFILYK